MQTLVDSYAQSILDTVRDVKPVKVTASGERQSAIELFRVGDDTGCGVHDTLKFVRCRFWCADQQTVAVVNSGTDKSMHQSSN